VFRSLRTLRSIPRIKDIALVLGKHGFHQVAGALQAPVTTRLRRIFKREPGHVIQQPERLRLVLEDLGPTFIKFGQLLSTRPDLLPPAYLEELGKLQDDVHPAPFEEVKETIQLELGRDLEDLYRSLDPEPLATASIAQVHRAVTTAGQEVVVKTRKRGLQRVIEQDIRVLGLLAEFLKDWPGLRLFDPEGIVQTFERTIRRELNFDYERNNLMRIRRNLPEDSILCVPRALPELSAEGVLTMEFLAGRKLSGLRQSGLPLHLGEETARGIALSLLKQIFEDGFFHADPHPGNFILMEGGRVGLIDLGNVGRLTAETTDDLVSLLVSLVERDYRRVARWILKQGQPSTDVDSDTLAMEVMDQLDPYFGLSLGEIRVGDLFNTLFAMVMRHGIRVPSQFVTAGRTFVILEGTVRLCAPQMQVLPEIQPYVEKVLRSRWGPRRVAREVEEQLKELFSTLKSFPTNLGEVLSKAADGRLRVETRNPDMRRLESKIETLAARLPLALLVCALILSSSVLLCVPEASGGSLTRILGVSGFAVAFFLGLRFFLR
jgi:ubiquinone biosynthesis protein